MEHSHRHDFEAKLDVSVCAKPCGKSREVWITPMVMGQSRRRNALDDYEGRYLPHGGRRIPKKPNLRTTVKALPMGIRKTSQPRTTLKRTKRIARSNPKTWKWMMLLKRQPKRQRQINR
jgi:hypothetical protein